MKRESSILEELPTFKKKKRERKKESKKRWNLESFFFLSFFFTFSEREIKVMNEKISMIGSKLEI